MKGSITYLGCTQQVQNMKCLPGFESRVFRFLSFLTFICLVISPERNTSRRHDFMWSCNRLNAEAFRNVERTIVGWVTLCDITSCFSSWMFHLLGFLYPLYTCVWEFPVMLSAILATASGSPSPFLFSALLCCFKSDIAVILFNIFYHALKISQSPPLPTCTMPCDSLCRLHLLTCKCV